MNEVVKSYITLKEMLVDRGTNIDMLNTISDTELNIMSKINKIFSIQVNEDTKIVYYTNPKFKINDLKKYFTDDDHIIMVFKEKINNLNIKNLKEQTNVTIEIFMMKELQYNISRHVLVPKHEIVHDNDEIDSLLNIYQLKKNQLPIILKTDPMARYLDVKAGNVVKITRKSPSAGEAILYRYCV
jgi:DNA-directed RNA polymerase I, II, and III subunit RPABC1